MFLDRFNGVRRTGWIITASGRKQRRQPELITANEQNEHAFHSRLSGCARSSATSSISISRASKLTSYAEGRGLTTRSTPSSVGRSFVRTSSRSLRRSRFRSTILCRCFPTTTAARACESRESLARTSRCSVRSRLPAFLTCSRSDSRVSLELRGYPNLLGAGVLAGQLNRQLLSSLLPASAQNLTTPASRHSLPEPMRPDTALITGTVGWLTHLMLQNSD